MNYLFVYIIGSLITFIFLHKVVEINKLYGFETLIIGSIIWPLSLLAILWALIKALLDLEIK